jgi:D-beta-D-heptose 7-phosphate kinase/D-beta-D-heptose 1-phosphate adenosyltransferase
VLVKGGDYHDREVVGRETVEARGGRVVLVPLVEGYSTSTIISRIRSSNVGEDT